MPSGPANLLLGRLALHYKLVTQEQLARAARLQTGGAQGMMLLDASLAELVRAGVVTREEALLHAEEPQRLMGAAA